MGMSLATWGKQQVDGSQDSPPLSLGARCGRGGSSSRGAVVGTGKKGPGNP